MPRLGVADAVAAQFLDDRRRDGLDGVVGDHHVEVDHVLRGEVRHRGRSDVFDPLDGVTEVAGREGVAEPVAFRAVQVAPLPVSRRDEFDRVVVRVDHRRELRAGSRARRSRSPRRR
jgi:hypothetical protein